MNNASYTTRLWRDENDYEQMRSLLRSTWHEIGHLANLTLGDLDWWRSTTNDPEIMSKVRLWFTVDSEELVAFVWPAPHQIDLMTHPQHRPLEAQIIDWAEAVWQQATTTDVTTDTTTDTASPSDAAQSKPFVIWSYDSDTHRQSLLQARGYQRNAEEFLTLYQYPLTSPPAPRHPSTLPFDPAQGKLRASPPPGYTIRSLSNEDDLQARVDVHRAAFHPSKMTVEKHRKVMASPTYRQELDLVVTSPDDTFAACTIVWWDEANQLGIFEPVACHPDHQRKGLASAVMVEGMQRLQRLGACVAHVMSHRDDSPGAYTYRTLGFQVVDRIYAWEKTEK